MEHEHNDEDQPMSANIVMNCDWTASDKPTSVCLKSVLWLFIVVAGFSGFDVAYLFQLYTHACTNAT